MADSAQVDAEKLDALRNVLIDDVIAILDTVPDDRVTDLNQQSRRSLVRSIFAAVEGYVFSSKQFSLYLHNVVEAMSQRESPGGQDTPRQTLSDAELSLCREEDIILADNGTAATTKMKLRTKPNIMFAFHAFLKVCGDPQKPDYSSRGWQRLCQALSTRDRLTHPKKVEDLTVTDAELIQALDGYTWFAEETMRMIGDHLERLRGPTKDDSGDEPAK